MPSYRPNVAFILQNQEGEILVCERSDRPGCWQFPQGGVEPDETRLKALHREVEEELGLRPADYRVLRSEGPYRYLFLNGVKKRGFDGQEQYYFLAEFHGSAAAIRLDHAHEFQAVRWIRPAEFEIEWVGAMKRAVYQQVLRDFFALPDVQT